MANKRKNQPRSRALPRKGERRRQRIRQPQVRGYVVHCSGCKRDGYTLETVGPIKFCVFCKSPDLTIRPETTEERQWRRTQAQRQLFDGIGRILGAAFGGFFGQQPPQRPSIQPSSDLEAELLRAGYRKLAEKYHPDKGGDPEKMKELNRLKDKHGL